MQFLKNLKKKAIEKIVWKKFISTIKPKEKFGDSPAPESPDYSRLEHWAAHPDKTDKSTLLCKGMEKHSGNLPADVFFIHPTSYFGAFNWNADLTAVGPNEFVDELLMPGQASVFNACCRIFAPRYRQATFYSFLEGGSNGRLALEQAYQDVLTAFDDFIKNYNGDRPFFIASHSQGTVHGIRLLEECIENTDLLSRFVGAYLVGFEMPRDKFGTAFKNIKPSASPTDTACIMAWDTYLNGGKTKTAGDLAEHWYAGENGENFWLRRNQLETFGVNPLTWKTTTEVAGSDKNQGAVYQVLGAGKLNWANTFKGRKVGVNTLGLSAPQPGEVPARLGKNGFLYIQEPKNSRFKKMLLPGGNYHNYDYALFYMNMRQNIMERLDAFMGK